MKNHASKIIALLLLGAASLSRSVLAQTPVAAPVAKPTLEVQISSSVRDGKNFLVLDPVQPHLNVVLRNVSDKPMQLFQEWNSWGYFNLHLEITAVNGEALSQVLTIQKGAKFWAADYASTETLRPVQSLVREVYFHVPSNIQYPETPEEVKRYFNAVDDDYWFFPLPNRLKVARRQENTVTMKAVFEVKSEDTGIPGVWQGRIESAPLTYEIYWAAPRR